MQVGESRIKFSRQSGRKGILQEHLGLFEKKGYSRYPTKPLFPNKNKERYSEKLLVISLQSGEKKDYQETILLWKKFARQAFVIITMN
ncbi:MAG: hypothetical protein U5J82_09760 [Desulfobacterales bacterium]|nr:hypothetical protein [Desulfobacterales bacterium]